MKHWDVFLSHSSKDKPRARVLRDSLRNEGVSVWFDEDQIVPGDSIPLKVEEGIDASEVIILCLSPQFLESTWTPAERAAFMYTDPSNGSRTVLPVLFERCSLPRTLSHLRWIDYREHSEVAVQQVLDALTAPLTKGSVAVNPPPRGVPHGVIAKPRRRPDVTDVGNKDAVGGNQSVNRLRADLAVALRRCLGDQKVVLALDLDGFTNINRVHGVAAGDRLIEVVHNTLAEWCKLECQAAPIVSCALTRGMDEWFILLGASTSESPWIADAASRLGDQVRSLNFDEIAPDLFVTACVSYVTYRDGESALTLLRRGLSGLRAAKRIGPGTVSSGPFTVKPLGTDHEEVVVNGRLLSLGVTYGLDLKHRSGGTTGFGTSGPMLFGGLAPKEAAWAEWAADPRYWGGEPE